MEVSTVIFDFAGVLTTGNFFPALAKRLSDKFGVDRGETEKRLYANEKAYMKGEETTKDFWEKCFPNAEITLEDFVGEFSEAYELNPAVLNIIKDIKKNYSTFLHSDNFDALSSAIKNDQRITPLFENMFFSNELGSTKEEENSFLAVLEDAGKKPSECVFIDDKEKNLKAPSKIGMHTLLFKEPEQLLIDLRNLGLKI